MALLGRPEGPGGTIGTPGGRHGGQGPLRGTSRWSMWAQGGLFGHLGEPREAAQRPRDAKGEPRDTKVGPRQAKGRPTEANITRQGHPSGAKMGPK